MMNLLQAFKDYRESRRGENDDPNTGLTSLNLKSISSMPQQPTGGTGWVDYRYGYGSNFPNSRIDFTKDVGDLRQSSLAISAITWLANGLYDARMRVIKKLSDQKEQEIDGHELTRLLERPNPFYSGQSLMAGIAMSWITGSEAYLLKVKARMGNVVELWYEPHWTIFPRWDVNGKDFVSFYEIERNGLRKRVEVDDVVHIRRGVDPHTRRGMIRPETALLREYYTDNQIIQFAAQMFRNGLVPPVVVGLGNKENPFTGDTEAFKQALVRKMSGDSAGEPMVTAGEVNVEKLGFDYSKIGLRETRQIPEERFCAAMGISAHSLKLGAAREASTYNNVKNYLAHDYRSYIVPLQKLIATEMNVQLLPDFGESKNLSVNWDYTQTFLMQSDKVIETKNTTLLYEKGVIDRAEAREAVGYKMREEDKGIYYTQPKSDTEDEPIGDVETSDEDEPIKAKGNRIPKKTLDESASFWREHTALDEPARDLIDATEYTNGKAN